MLAGLPTCARLELFGHARWRVEDSLRVGECLRKAFMAVCGEFGRLPSEISGHEGKKPAQGHRHAYFLPDDEDWDGLIDHAIIFLPGGMTLSVQRSLEALRFLRPLQVSLRLQGMGMPEDFAALTSLCGPSAVWTSFTPYLHPWYQKKHGVFGPVDQLKREIELAQEFPPVQHIKELEGVGVRGRVLRVRDFCRVRTNTRPNIPDFMGTLWQVTFSQSVAGPLSFGRDSHFGLGLFRAGYARGRN